MAQEDPNIIIFMERMHIELILYINTYKLCLYIIAEPEGETTNLDAQVAERLYICMFIYTSIEAHLRRASLLWRLL